MIFESVIKLVFDSMRYNVKRGTTFLTWQSILLLLIIIIIIRLYYTDNV